MIGKALRRLSLIVLYGLSYAPVALIGGEKLLGEPLAAFALLLLTVPLAALLSLVPGHIGGKVKQAEPTEKVEHRFETESEQRFLAEDAAKRRLPLRVPLCVVVMLALAMGAAFLPLPMLAQVVWYKRLVQGILSAALLPFALLLLSEPEGRLASTCVSGFVLYLVASVYLVFEPQPELNRALYTLGLCFLLMAALLTNEQALVNGAANRQSGRPSRRMLVRNRLLLLVMAIVGAVILYFDQIRSWCTHAARQALIFMWEALVWLTNLFMDKPQGGSGGEGGGDDLSGLMEGGESGAFWVFTEKILVVIAVLLMLCVAYWLGRKIYLLMKKLILKLLGKLKSAAAQLGEDYVDEQESLMDWGDLGKNMRDDLRKRLERLTRREKRWEQMDAREKVRFVVRSLYRKAGEQAGLSSLTIHEAAPRLNHGSASAQELAQLYDQARYAPTAPEAERAEKLRKDVRA